MNLINEIAKLASNNSNAFTAECQSSPSVSNNHYENCENKLTELKPFFTNHQEHADMELIYKIANEISPEVISSEDDESFHLNDHPQHKLPQQSAKRKEKRQELRLKKILDKKEKKQQQQDQREKKKQQKQQLIEEQKQQKQELKVQKNILKQKSELPVKRKINFEYIKNNQERADVKYKRNKGLIKKIEWFDKLTGSQSCLLTIDRKSKLKIFSNGSLFNEAIPEIKAALSNEDNTKISEANCDLIDEKKEIWQSSQRIINHKENDEIMYRSLPVSSNQMRCSRSIDFMNKDFAENSPMKKHLASKSLLKSNQNIVNRK